MNIEEIEKEILTLNIHECDIEDIFEILDKYNNQPDYKSAFKELKEYLFETEIAEFNFIHSKEISRQRKSHIEMYIDTLEQKYNLVYELN